MTTQIANALTLASSSKSMDTFWDLITAVDNNWTARLASYKMYRQLGRYENEH